MKYSYFRHKNPKMGYGFKNQYSKYCMVRNNETNKWFSVGVGESVSARDNAKNYMTGIYEFGMVCPYPSYVEQGIWIQYARRPKQIKP